VALYVAVVTSHAAMHPAAAQQQPQQTGNITSATLSCIFRARSRQLERHLMALSIIYITVNPSKPLIILLSVDVCAASSKHSCLHVRGWPCVCSMSASLRLNIS